MGRWLIKMRRLIGRARLERELEEEQRFHLEMAEQEKRAAGLQPEAARSQARREFGNPTRTIETSRELFAFVRLETLWRDLRYGARSLRRNPALIAVAVLSLGLGIGANATVYSLIDALMLHDVTARDPERLVRFSGLSYPNYQEVRDSGVFDGLAAFHAASLNWRQGDRTSGVFAHAVSANFFDVIGVNAAAGRLFDAREDAPERNPRVVVVGYRFWKRRLGGDAEVVGRVLILNGAPFTVVGVLPEHYRSIMGLGLAPEIFMPLNRLVYPRLDQRRFSVLIPVGRVPEGRTRAQARDALTATLRGLEERYPEENRNLGRPQALVPATGFERLRSVTEAQPMLLFSVVLSAVVALILLIACANVAGLLLARGAARSREMAIRLAIGAGRGRLVEQLLAESFLLGMAGAVAGLAFTFWAGELLTRVRLPLGPPIGFDFAPDFRLVAVTAGLGLLAVVLCGLAPALRSTRPALAPALKSAQAAAPGRLRLRTVLVGGQIAISVVLVACALLFVRNLLRVLDDDPGFDTAHTIWLDVHPDGQLTSARQIALREGIVRALEAAPRVEAVSWAGYLPFNWEYWEPEVRRSDGPASARFRVTGQGVGPGYLKTMRIPLVAGREFDGADLRNASPIGPDPVMINEAFARGYFPDRDPLGQRLLWSIGRDRESPLVIVGIARNTKFRTPAESPVPLLYLLTPSSLNFVVRVSGSAPAAAPVLAGLIGTVDRDAGVGFSAVSERMSRASWPARFSATLLGILAAVGLALALIGVCGVAIYNVTRRTPEIGIRMALGSTRGDILGLMLRDGLGLIAVGAAAGFVIALWATRPLGRLLADGISPADPLSFTGVLLLLVAAGGAAILVPARRATRVDPGACLRYE